MIANKLNKRVGRSILPRDVAVCDFCRFRDQRDDGLMRRAAAAPEFRMALDAKEKASARHFDATGDPGIGGGGADDKPASFQRWDQGGVEVIAMVQPLDGALVRVESG